MAIAVDPVHAEPIAFPLIPTPAVSIPAVSIRATPSMSLDQLGMGDWTDRRACRSR
jgi:hypothetical protein